MGGKNLKLRVLGGMCLFFPSCGLAYKCHFLPSCSHAISLHPAINTVIVYHLLSICRLSIISLASFDLLSIFIYICISLSVSLSLYICVYISYIYIQIIHIYIYEYMCIYKYIYIYIIPRGHLLSARGSSFP